MQLLRAELQASYSPIEFLLRSSYIRILVLGAKLRPNMQKLDKKDNMEITTY